jgi:hypothetical protein
MDHHPSLFHSNNKPREWEPTNVRAAVFGILHEEYTTAFRLAARSFVGWATERAELNRNQKVTPKTMVVNR